MGISNTSLETHENVSLTRSLTKMTNNWYQKAHNYDAGFGTILLGQVGSRAINILIIPTALIDTIRNVTIGIFTIAIGAPCGKVYNSVKWIMGSKTRSRFSFAGGIISLMNAKKHLPLAILGTLAGILNPEKIGLFYQKNDGKSKKEMTEIFQEQIEFCHQMNLDEKVPMNVRAAYKSLANDLKYKLEHSLALLVSRKTLESQEKMSFIKVLTNWTNKHYQKAKSKDAGFGTILAGSIGSRIINILIVPTALIDTVDHLATGIFTLGIGAPIGKVYNFIQWCRNNPKRSRFSFAGGIINFMNAKNHLLNSGLATVAGILNPEKAANFFRTNDGSLKRDNRSVLRHAITFCKQMENDSNTTKQTKEIYKDMAKTLKKYL